MCGVLEIDRGLRRSGKWLERLNRDLDRFVARPTDSTADSIEKCARSFAADFCGQLFRLRGDDNNPLVASSVRHPYARLR
jgi:hypothetical protein